MVQIIIPNTQLHPQSADGKSPSDWLMIELQGSLTADGSDNMAGSLLGKMEMRPNGTAYLYIGHHRLEGQKVELQKPLALIRKRQHNAPKSVNSGSGDRMDVDQPEMDRVQTTTESAHNSQTMDTDSIPSLPPPLNSDGSISQSNGDIPSSSEEENRPGGLIGVPSMSTQHNRTASIPSEYDVVTIVRYKYLFKSRPQHLLGAEHRGLNAITTGGKRR